jgi:hypothetical protein
MAAKFSICIQELADGPVFEPDRARHAIYQAAIARQEWLYDRLIAAS